MAIEVVHNDEPPEGYDTSSIENDLRLTASAGGLVDDPTIRLPVDDDDPDKGLIDRVRTWLEANPWVVKG